MSDTQCSTYVSSKGEIDARLYEASFDCIKILDPSGYLLHLNPGGILALELENSEQLHGQHWADSWPEASKGIVDDAISKARTGERVQFEAFCPTVKGTPRWWNVMVSPIADHTNKIYQLMVVSRDVTEVYLAKEALREADRRKDEFLTMLAHELRTPLSATGLAANVLTSKKLEPDRTVQLGHLISRQVGHMSRLAEDLLDISRVSRGLLNLHLEPITMKQVVQEAADQLQGVVAAKGHTLTVNFCDDECPVLGDHVRLVQVVANLLSNAARYTPNGGYIHIELKRLNDDVMVSVSDTGIGIAPEQIPRLFELYAQVERSSNAKNSGLGLGLTLVRNLIELHAGHVSAFSDGEGKGTTFKVHIPASD